MEKCLSRGEKRSKLVVGTNATLRTSLFTNVFCPLTKNTLRRLLKCWQMASLPELGFWDSRWLEEWLSQLLLPSGGGGSTYRSRLVWGHKDLALLAQFCTDWKRAIILSPWLLAVSEETQSSSEDGGELFFLTATLDPELLSGSAGPCHSQSRSSPPLVYPCVLSSFHRQAHQEHFWKTRWTNIIVHSLFRSKSH